MYQSIYIHLYILMFNYF